MLFRHRRYLSVDVLNLNPCVFRRRYLLSLSRYIPFRICGSFNVVIFFIVIGLMDDNKFRRCLYFTRGIRRNYRRYSGYCHSLASLSAVLLSALALSAAVVTSLYNLCVEIDVGFVMTSSSSVLLSSSAGVASLLYNLYIDIDVGFVNDGIVVDRVKLSFAPSPTSFVVSSPTSFSVVLFNK